MEERWYVRFRGHTLGPLTTDQVRVSLRKKELGLEDKLSSTQDPAWRSLKEISLFSAPPSAAPLSPLPPSPRLTRKKLPAPLPATEVEPARAAEPKQPTESQATSRKAKRTPEVLPGQPPARGRPGRKSKKQLPPTITLPPMPEPIPEETLSLLASLKDLARPDPMPAPVAPARRNPRARRWPIFFLSVLVGAGLWLGLSHLVKTRGPENFRLPDPSHPTIQPSPEEDPIPSLKAPTRPKRDD